MKLQLSRYVLAAVLASAVMYAQTISSTLKGTVQDSSGAVVPGAMCKLTNPSTGVSLTVTSSKDGGFQFLDILAGTYTLAVSAPGFKSFDLNGIEILSSEFHSAGNITLQVGQSSDSIQVTEAGTPVQLSSGERSDTITGRELNDIAVKGRDFMSYLSLIPGIVDTNASRDAMQRNATSGIQINGNRSTQTLLMMDGVPIIDSGNNGASQEPNMDSIAEVRVLTNSYQPEYGRNGGGAITVVSKTGTNRIHGSAYDYYRDEELNANNFFNNSTNTPRPVYRYRMTGWSLGGPVIAPKTKNLFHDKLFFFFSEELVGSQVPNATKLVTTPTALERQGNFSQSYNTNGALIKITDPTTKAQFPGNIIPVSRINPTGQAILNFFPLPNYVDPSPSKVYSYNYRDTYSGGWPRRQNMGRMDYNVTPTLTVYYRVMDDYSSLLSPWGAWVNGNANYLVTPVIWDRPARTHSVHVTKIFSSSLVDELNLGKAFNGVYISPLDPSKVQRSAIGNPPELYQSATGQPGWLPGIAFGGTPANTINPSLANQLPEGLPCTAYVIQNNLSKVWKTHQIKVGIYTERNHKQQPAASAYRGNYNFANDGNNPGNTGDGFSNALLGNIDMYTQANNWPIGSYLFWDTEWYVQDNWRVTRRLTLDYGIRFYHQPATVDNNHTIASFNPLLYNPAQAPVLYRSGKDASGAAAAINPITGATAPAVYVGQFVPGVGNPSDGAAVAGINGYPAGLYTTPAIAYGPRFGFAYDLFGNGRTALRGGFGVFKDKIQGNETYNLSGQAPVTQSPTIYYTNFATLAQGASQGLINAVAGPSTTTQIYGLQPLPSVMNFNLGIQHQLQSMTFDVAYVGSLNRHLPIELNLNPIPIYSMLQPQNAGLTANFLRPYQGYADINQELFAGTSNYNSLQASMRRRFTRGLQFGASYTFAKALGTASADGDKVSSYFPARSYNYGPLTFNRTQTMAINYLYDVPNLGTKFGIRQLGWVTDNWQVSGITTFQTGAPFLPGFTTTNGENITGSTDGARIEVLSNPYDNIPAGHYFNPAAFAVPKVGTFGNAGPNILYGPGINNWDLSLTKRFKFSESRTLAFRGEAFNAFNHTQFSSVYTTANFNPTTGAQIDPNFGLPSAARNPRNIQLSARFMF
jgi:hypothetical protein